MPSRERKRKPSYSPAASRCQAKKKREHDQMASAAAARAEQVTAFVIRGSSWLGTPRRRWVRISAKRGL